MPRLDFYVNFNLYVMIKIKNKEIIIGRSPECDIILPNNRVSRCHAVIKQDDGDSHFLEDLSSNGTRVNGTMVMDRKQLSPGDRIYIHDFTLIYQPDDAQPESLTHMPTMIL